MRRGLVLGGGGLIGMAYHAGALKALADWGVDLARSDLVVGTSAGSIIGSYLAAGWKPTDFYDYALGKHLEAARRLRAREDEVSDLFVPLWQSRQERIRRTIGSFFALAASRPSWPVKGWTPATALRKAFPAGMYSTARTKERLGDDLPEEWPSRPLYICTTDLYTGKRVVFGHPDAPPARLADAVLASTAIPGMFPPVRIGDRHYVDGGAVSATSLDLAVDDGCGAILCVAPLGYRSEGELVVREPRLWPAVAVRQYFARTLRREVQQAREQGADVFVVRPWLSDLRDHGANSMRDFDRAALARAGRDGTLRLLDAHAEHPDRKSVV